jgi:hypothetical protein
MFLNIIKAEYNKPIANIIVNIYNKVRNEKKMSTLSILIQCCTRCPSQGSKIGGRNKRNYNREGKFKLSLFLDDLI